MKPKNTLPQLQVQKEKYLIVNYLGRYYQVLIELEQVPLLIVKIINNGQVDAVIELPFSLSFPVSSEENRLYLADTVGAAFEIKSNLNAQWEDAIKKIKEIKQLNRINTSKEKYLMGDTLKIPSFIIGFTGPKNIDTLYKKLGNLCDLDKPDGVLIIEHGIFYGRAAGCNSVYEAETTQGALLSFVSCLYKVLRKYSSNSDELDEYRNIL